MIAVIEGLNHDVDLAWPSCGNCCLYGGKRCVSIIIHEERRATPATDQPSGIQNSSLNRLSKRQIIV